MDEHYLADWWPHSFDHQTTIYKCHCGHKTTAKAWIDQHVKESNAKTI